MDKKSFLEERYCEINKLKNKKFVKISYSYLMINIISIDEWS